MKRLNIILLLSALLLSNAVNAQKIDILNPSIEKIGNNITISFEAFVEIVTFDAKISKMATNSKLTLTPVLWNEDIDLPLSSIIVMGRNKAISEKRKGTMKQGSIIGDSNKRIPYKITIPFETWMSGISLRLDKTLEGCCEKVMLSPISILDNQLMLTPTLAPIVPLFGSNIKAYHLKAFSLIISDYPFVYLSGSKISKGSGLTIHFEQRKSTIQRSYMDNENSLNDINEAIAMIQLDSMMEISHINVIGGSSPEGSARLNEKLGQARAKSLVNYFTDDVDSSLFKIENLGENWGALYDMVEKSNMESLAEILFIIGNYSVTEGREKLLMDLDGGDPYRYMLKEFFPKLRKASYLQVFYNLRVNDDFAKIDKASELIKSNSYDESLILLQDVTPTAYTYNLMGVCYMMMGDFENARIYLQRAIDDGNNDAHKNLEQIDSQSDNVQYN